MGVTPLQLQKAVVVLRYRRVVHRRSRARPIRWRASACGQPVFMPPTVHSRADSPAPGPVAPRRCERSCSPRPLPRCFCCAGRSAAPVSFAHTRLAFGCPDHRRSALDQQRAQIRVAVFLMPRSHCLPPLESCLGTNPSQAASCCPFDSVDQPIVGPRRCDSAGDAKPDTTKRRSDT